MKNVSLNRSRPQGGTPVAARIGAATVRERSLCMGIVTLAMATSLCAQIAYDSAPDPLKLPERIHLGEAAGVATNSKGNLFVYTRPGGANATGGASRPFPHG